MASTWQSQNSAQMFPDVSTSPSSLNFKTQAQSLSGFNNAVNKNSLLEKARSMPNMLHNLSNQQQQPNELTSPNTIQFLNGNLTQEELLFQQLHNTNNRQPPSLNQPNSLLSLNPTSMEDLASVSTMDILNQFANLSSTGSQTQTQTQTQSSISPPPSHQQQSISPPLNNSPSTQLLNSQSNLENDVASEKLTRTQYNPYQQLFRQENINGKLRSTPSLDSNSALSPQSIDQTSPKSQQQTSPPVNGLPIPQGQEQQDLYRQQNMVIGEQLRIRQEIEQLKQNNQNSLYQLAMQQQSMQQPSHVNFGNQTQSMLAQSMSRQISPYQLQQYQQQQTFQQHQQHSDLMQQAYTHAGDQKMLLLNSSYLNGSNSSLIIKNEDQLKVKPKKVYKVNKTLLCKEQGCGRKFSSHSSLSNHLRIKHSKKKAKNKEVQN